MTRPDRSTIRMTLMGVGLLAVLTLVGTVVVAQKAPADLVTAQTAAPNVLLTDPELDAARTFRPFSDVIPVVAYHDISDDGAPDSITPEQFAAQMAMLDQAGFATVTLDQARSLVLGVAVDLPKNPILLTFDGGATSAWTHADPILAQHGFTGVEFVPTSELSSASDAAHLNVATLERMIDSGRWDIGGNTHLGDRLMTTDSGEIPWMVNRRTINGVTETDSQWRSRVLDDLVLDRSQLRQLLEIDAVAMSYPSPKNDFENGERALTDQLPAVVGTQFDLGFRDAANPTAASDSSVSTNIGRVRGFGVDASPIALLGAIDQAIPRTENGAVTTKRWTTSGQGACLAQDSTLVVTSDGFTACRLDLPDGGPGEDVRTFARVSGISADSTASFRVRVGDDSWLEVTIAEHRLTVEQSRNGTSTELLSDPIDLTPLDGSIPVLIEVRGTRLQVTLDAEPPRQVEVPPAPNASGVMITATTRGAGVVTFTNLDIVPFSQAEAEGS